MKHFRCIIIVLLLLAVVAFAGCARQVGDTDEPTEFMAWQFAQGVVRPRVMRPGNAVFPRYSASFIERPGNNEFIITAYLNTLDAQNNTITYDFKAVVKYAGNDMFREVLVEVKKR
ncbi:MAG: hypothetical protein KGZ79_07040 [Dethiobacter sp.]|jgi:hypothetical protein|nr:hypothetical protein [Dethiobacter sp.]